MEEIVYLNGYFLPRSQARLSPFDHGFLYGYGLFETMRAYEGCLFRLQDHLARLRYFAQFLGFRPRLDSFNLEEACLDTLKANKLTEARLRLTVSGGEGDIIPDPDSSPALTVFVAARKYVPLLPEVYERGFKAILSSFKRNSQSLLSRLKSTSYIESVLARREAKGAGADEALLLNEQGFLAEGSLSNIFLVVKGRLITPSLDSGILPGITRKVVLELASSLNIEVNERKVRLEELLKADEAFLTNSLIEIMPLTEFDGKFIGGGKSGVLSKELMSVYRELVKRTIAQEVHSFGTKGE